MKKQVISQQKERRTAACGISQFDKKSSLVEEEEYGA
jgi:hypothetical protein